MTSQVDELTSSAQQWHVAIESTFETETSWLAFGIRDNFSVVLKISKEQGEEWQSGKILRAFNGDGMVRVSESKPGAVLLERLVPGNDLVRMVRDGDDNHATRLLANVISQMSNHAPPSSCPTVFDWARGFDRYLNSGNQQIPIDMVLEAGEVYRSLATSASRTTLLHGDLHHYNVLFDENRGWVAIDPKGVVGELEYEVGAILRNPMALPEIFTSREVAERRLRILTDALQLDYQRALQWSFGQAVLSAIWDIEDGNQVQPNHPTLQLAETLQQMFR